MKEILLEKFAPGHIYNLCAIEKKLGMRKLKLNEFIKGRIKLTDDEMLKISELLENESKMQK